MTRCIDTETGKEIEPIAVDTVTGAKIGSRPMHGDPERLANRPIAVAVITRLDRVRL